MNKKIWYTDIENRIVSYHLNNQKRWCRRDRKKLKNALIDDENKYAKQNIADIDFDSRQDISSLVCWFFEVGKCIILLDSKIGWSPWWPRSWVLA